MLKLETPTGSLELSADQERAVRSMTDADVCRDLEAIFKTTGAKTATWPDTGQMCLRTSPAPYATRA
jgi:hypothetical protein